MNREMFLSSGKLPAMFFQIHLCCHNVFFYSVPFVFSCIHAAVVTSSKCLTLSLLKLELSKKITNEGFEIILQLELKRKNETWKNCESKHETRKDYKA